MPKLFNEKTAFDQKNEIYVGTWFEHDIWIYMQAGRANLLAVHGNEPGDYATWIGDVGWFQDGKKIGYPGGKSVLMAEHLTTECLSKAFLMGFAAVHHMFGPDASELKDRYTSLSVAAGRVRILRTAVLTSDHVERSEESEHLIHAAVGLLNQAEAFLQLAELKSFQP